LSSTSPLSLIAFRIFDMSYYPRTLQSTASRKKRQLELLECFPCVHTSAETWSRLGSLNCATSIDQHTDSDADDRGALPLPQVQSWYRYEPIKIAREVRRFERQQVRSNWRARMPPSLDTFYSGCQEPIRGLCVAKPATDKDSRHGTRAKGCDSFYNSFPWGSIEESTTHFQLNSRGSAADKRSKPLTRTYIRKSSFDTHCDGLAFSNQWTEGSLAVIAAERKRDACWHVPKSTANMAEHHTATRAQRISLGMPELGMYWF
jgi:hypothetical protein